MDQQTATTIWNIVEPVVTLFAGIVLPLAFAWIAKKLETWLSIKSADDQAAFEAKLRDALHKSAQTALQLVLLKSGVTSAVDVPAVVNLLKTNSSALAAAIASVKTKNPDAVAKLGVSDQSIADIIVTQAPTVVASLLAASK